MEKELLLWLVSIPFLVLLAYGYNVLSSYFRYKAKTSTVPFNVKMEGYVGWTGMIALLFIPTTHILGIN